MKDTVKLLKRQQLKRSGRKIKKRFYFPKLRKQIKMSIRQKWTEHEDASVIDLVRRSNAKTPDWALISKQLATLGIRKAARQIRERWNNHLDPCLEEKSLTSEDNMRLFDLHCEFGNAWKKISQQFKGSSDNRIKNQFFAMIRKSLRKARKALKQSFNTAQVNQIKPKMLSKFLEKHVEIPKEIHSKVKGFSWTHSNPIKVKDFIQFFLNSKNKNLEKEITPSVAKQIEFILSKLEEENEEYVSQSKVHSCRKKSQFASQVSLPPAQPKSVKDVPPPTSIPSLPIVDSMLLLGDSEFRTLKNPPNEASPFPFSFVNLPTPINFFPQTTDTDHLNHLYRKPTTEYNNAEGGLLSAPKNLPYTRNVTNDVSFNITGLGMDFDTSPKKMSRKTTFERNLPTKDAILEEAGRKMLGAGPGLRKQETKESVDSMRKLRMDYF